MNSKTSGCPYSVDGQFWFQKNNEPFLTEKTVELLLQIEELGSIAQAAKAVEISYQKAWNLIDKANRGSKLPIVIRQRGGNAGGGAAVTAQGRKLLQQFERIREQFAVFIDKSMDLLDV